MPKELGHELRFDELRKLLNPNIKSDVIEYLYADTVDGDRRWLNLVSYFSYMYREKPEMILVGEAPGYRGTTVSGVPFLSEDIIRSRQLSGVKLPLTNYAPSQNFTQKSGFEATSTFMWSVLDELKAPKLPLLWAVFPNHPHASGDIFTNRKPTKTEITSYLSIVPWLVEAFDIQYIVAIGNVAFDTLSSNTNRTIVKLRHPARGGSKQFRDGLHKAVEAIYGDE